MKFMDKLKKGFKASSNRDKIWAGACFLLALGLFVYFITLMF